MDSDLGDFPLSSIGQSEQALHCSASEDVAGGDRNPLQKIFMAFYDRQAKLRVPQLLE